MRRRGHARQPCADDRRHRRRPPLYRDALSQAITARPDLELLAAATDGRSALEQIRELSPDVAVLDMRMPGLRGIDVVEALARDGSATRVLVLSAAQASAVVCAA